MAETYDYIDEFSKQLARKRQLAKLLQERSLQGMNLANPYARASWANVLGGLGQAWAGKSLDEQANQEGLTQEQAQNVGLNSAIEKLRSIREGTPATPDMNLPGDLSNLALGQPPVPSPQLPPSQPSTPQLSMGERMVQDQNASPTPMLPQIGEQAASAPPLVPNPVYMNFSGSPDEVAALTARAQKDMARRGVTGQAIAGPDPMAAATNIPPMPPQGLTPPPTLAGPAQPTDQLLPDMAPKGLMLPGTPGRTPTAYDMLDVAQSMAPGRQRMIFTQEALKNMLTEPDKVAAQQMHNETLRAQYAGIAQQRAASLAQQAQVAYQNSQDRNRSIEERAQSAKEARELQARHYELMAQIAANRGGNAGGNAPAEVPGDFSKKGNEFLASLPPEDAAVIQKIATGEIPLTTFSTRGGHREALAKQVAAYDPTFNATRSSVWKDFTTGLPSRNITAINTAISHMGTMANLADALQNNDIQAANKIINFFSQQTGNPEVTNFETARQAVGEELMRTFRVAGASEHEAQAWMDKFKTANSPQQLRGSLATAGDLLGGRIKAVNDQWKRGTQSDKDFPNIIPPENLQVLQKLGVKQTGLSKKTETELTGGTSAPTGKVDIDKETSDARAAIVKGAPADKVRALFRQKTGQDLP